MTQKTRSKFEKQVHEFGVGGIAQWCAFPHFHKYNMAASRCPINILTAKRKSSRRAWVQEKLKHDPLRCSMFTYPTACRRVRWLQRGPLRCAFQLKTLCNCYVFVRVCFWFMIFKSTCIPPHVTRKVASNWTHIFYSANTYSVSMYLN